MNFKIVATIEFPTCENNNERVQTILKALADVGTVQDGDQFFATNRGEFVKISVYRPQPNGSGGDAEM